MKDKEPESYIEKPRVRRDRTKTRRVAADEKVNSDEVKPRMEPYHRNKAWVNQQDEE